MSYRLPLINFAPAFRAGLTRLSGLAVLIHLALEGDLCLTDLARRAGVSSAAITGTIDMLEELGLVARVRDSSDRRAVFATLRPDGSDLLKAIFPPND